MDAEEERLFRAERLEYHNLNMRLEAENERLQEELQIHAQSDGVSEWRRQECLRLQAEIERLRAENEALRFGGPSELERTMADNERLRAALRTARGEICWWANEHGCCKGKEDETIQLIDDTLNEQTSVNREPLS